MIYFTSDIHHRHKRICEITDRHKVIDQEHHDEWLIELWNSQVTKQDIVYHLGDFSFASKYEDVAAFTTRLNGAIFLLKGNHDKTDNLNKLKSNNLIQHWYDYKEIQIKGITTCMFHFPISSWHKQHYGSFCLHGHSHGNHSGNGKLLDVGLDSAYNILGEHRLFTQDEVYEILSNKSVTINDSHRKEKTT